MKTGIIFSCFNIEHTLKTKKLLQVLSEEENYHFCFVNDCSTDKTEQILNSIKLKVPHRTSVINLEKKSGRSEAIKAGVDHLKGLNFINYIGFFKDTHHLDFEGLNSMVESLHSSENISIVFGLEQKINDEPFLIDLFLKKCPCGKQVNKFLKLKGSTMVFSKSIAPIIFDRPFLSNHFFYLEIVLRLKLLFGEKNLRKFILIKKLREDQSRNKESLSFNQSLNFPILLFRFCINYTLLSNGHLLVR